MAELGSHHFPQDGGEFDALFSELTSSDDVTLMTKAVSDPYIERAHQNVRAYNDILAYEGVVSVDESFGIQGELDAQWAGVGDEEVGVTGRVYIVDRGEKTEFIVNDARMTSKGFTVRGASSFENEKGEVYLENPRVQHAFRVGRAVLDATMTGKRANKKTWAYAEIDDVLIEAQTVSTERAAAWVENNYPELFEEVNARVFNADGDEGDSLLSLKGLDIVAYAPVDDDFTRECIQSYLQDIVDLEGTFYSLGISGAYEVEEAGTYRKEELQVLLDKGALTCASGPYIECEVGENAPDVWSIVTHFTLILPKKSSQPVRIKASIDAVKAMYSISAAYYGS